jgi:squalene synthase HpnC
LLPVPVEHYENFPVASWLLPKRLRRPVEAIYRFARSADDIADEGDAPPEARLAELATYHAELDRIERGETPTDPVFGPLAAAIRAHEIPIAPFRDLLSAFAQDVLVTRYAGHDDLLDYCRRSANPIGRLLLALYGVDSPQAMRWSDSICSGLQLANFWQDVAIDWAKGRVYIPQNDLRAHGLADGAIAAGWTDGRWPALMRALTGRSRNMLVEGTPLARLLPGRIGWELRLVIQGGLRVLEAIDAADGDVFRRRPQLRKADWLTLSARALAM